MVLALKFTSDSAPANGEVERAVTEADRVLNGFGW